MHSSCRAIFFILLVACCSSQYQPNWESLDSRPVPEWYLDAKFGIKIHWGIYSVPSWGAPGVYAEWYGWQITLPNSLAQQFHNKTYGPNYKYNEFVEYFTAELFDPEEWADIIVRSGAKYVIPTSKHHEGWCLWPSAQSWNWNSVDTGPKMDLIGALFTAVRNAGLHPAAYFSLYEWFNPLYTGPDPSIYVEEIMLPQMYDLVNTYQPEILWVDGEWDHNSTFWHSPEFLAWLYNDSPVKDIVVVNDRWGNDCRGVHGGFFSAEYSTEVWLNHAWEQDSGVDVFSFGLNRNTDSDHYWSTEYLLGLLTRSVAFGGNMLLNIAPARDGTIPAIMQERILEIGDWLAVNGEAIYNSRIWRVQQDLVFPTTQTYTYYPNSTTVYGLCTEWMAHNCSTVTVKMTPQNSAADCQSLCDKNSTCLSWTWYEPDAEVYPSYCFIRVGNDDSWGPMYQAGAISARKDHFTINYTFQNKTGEQTVYAIVQPWPTAPLYLPSPKPTAQTSITLVGYNDTPLPWKGTVGDAGIYVVAPTLSVDEIPCDYQYTFQMVGVN